MGFPRPKYWSGLPFPSAGDPPDPGINPHLLCLLHWQASSLPLSHLGSPDGPIPLTNTNHVKYVPKQVSLHNDPWGL